MIRKDDRTTAEEVRTLEIGVIVRANILAGELENGEPAGLSPHYRIRGVGLVPMRDGYQCWAAVITSYDPAPQCGCSCIRCECDGCGEAITAEAAAQGWPIPRLTDSTSIGPCCYGEEAWCPEGHAMDAHSEDATCAVCEVRS